MPTGLWETIYFIFSSTNQIHKHLSVNINSFANKLIFINGYNMLQVKMADFILQLLLPHI